MSDENFDWSQWKKRQSIPKKRVRKSTTSKNDAVLQQGKRFPSVLTAGTSRRSGFVPEPRQATENTILRQRRDR
jgi:hypothetical protein